jgi:glycosyltransferase involved in cell wall biosynthesis
MKTPNHCMKIAYLTNQYPKISHTFIRREIDAVVRADSNLEVFRYSIRPTPDRLLDPADIAEQQITDVVLSHGFISLLLASIRVFLTRPLKFLGTLLLAIRLGRHGSQGCLWHIFYLAEAAWLLLQFQSKQITHVHVHFGTNPATVALLCRVLGGPTYSFTVHGPEEFDRPESLQLKTKIAYCQFVVAVSSFGRSQLCRWSAFRDWPKIKVVRCGLPADDLDQTVTQVKDNQRLVCVGRLSEQKGQFLLVEAARILRDAGTNFELVLVGDGELRSEIERLIAAAKLQNCVRIIGWQTSQQVRDWLQKSRAFVLPSFAEGLPVSIMEAFAAGRPVVSTYIAGTPELVRPGENGWLVPAGSSEALAAALKDVLATSTDVLTDMGACGKQMVQERHRADFEAAKLAKLFNNIGTPA